MVSFMIYDGLLREWVFMKKHQKKLKIVENSDICLKKRNLSYDYKFFYSETDRAFLAI